MFSPRALFLALPALMVVVGAVLMARSPEWAMIDSSSSPDDYGSEISIGLTPVDESRMDIIHQKQLIARDLLNDRVPLSEAADRFLALNQSSSEALANLRFGWQGRTDWECALRQAMAFARSLSRKDPERWVNAMARIDSEAATIVQSEPFIR